MAYYEEFLIETTEQLLAAEAALQTGTDESNENFLRSFLIHLKQRENLLIAIIGNRMSHLYLFDV